MDSSKKVRELLSSFRIHWKCIVIDTKPAYISHKPKFHLMVGLKFALAFSHNAFWPSYRVLYGVFLNWSSLTCYRFPKYSLNFRD